MPLVTDADACDQGWISFEADDGYTYYYDPGELDADGDGGHDGAGWTSFDLADATGDTPTPFYDDSFPPYSWFADVSEAPLAEEEEQTCDHAAVLRAMSGIARPIGGLGIATAAAAGATILTSDEGHRQSKARNSNASHAQSEPPMNPRARFWRSQNFKR